MRKIRCALALLASGAALVGAPAVAQVSQFGQYQEDPGAALTRHLRTLAEQPQSIDALKGAGRAALALGDAQAALTFFARAEEIAPRDGRVKAGMGSAFLQMEKPREAMKFFDEARSLAVPEAEFAGDRGLVHDLSGDPVRAQADYNLALRREEDPEVRRRLALSLAISGDRARALQTIDAQLRQQDRAAWRVRAFILALTGDVTEATRAAESAMPWQAGQMRPFLARLPSLSPAQRAMAVHFGNMPADGQPVRIADASPYATAAGTPVPPQAGSTATLRQGTPAAAAPVSTAPRRRPGEAEKAPASERPRSSSGRISGFDMARGMERRREVPAQTRSTQVAEAKPRLPAPIAETKPAPSVRTATPAPTPAQPVAAVPEAARTTTVPGPSAAPTAVEPQTSLTPIPGLSSWSLQPPAGSTPSAIVSTDLPPSAVAPPSADASAAVATPPAAQPTAVAPPVTEPTTPPASVSTSGLQPGSAGQPSRPGFASVAALVAGLPAADASSAAQPEPRQPEAVPFKKAVPAEEPSKPAPAKAVAEKKAPAKAPVAKPQAAQKVEAAAKKEKAEPAKAKAPSRIWVQVAGGADKKALPREFSRLKAKAPKLLAGTTAWTTPLRATNRLLVGPFKTEKEAQALVNELNRLDFSAFSWTSPAGQEIEKLGAQ